MTDPAALVPFTCLGCGLACDDVAAEVAGGTVRGTARLCALGTAWLGDGRLPAAVRVRGRETGLGEAVDAAAALLTAARGRALVWLGPGLSVQALRAAVQLADHLRAAVDTATSATAASGILAAQRRGRASATLGELRNRADLVILWGVDAARRYPRLAERLLAVPAAAHLADPAARAVVRVAVGEDGLADAPDLRVGAADELAALAVLRAAALGQPAEVTAAHAPLAALGARVREARYVVLLTDGEDGDPARPPQRAEALTALGQALNGPTRAAHVVLRAGGNRSGVESLLTWQTGFPFAVDFGPGHPTYAPERRPLEVLAAGRFSAALVAGDAAALPAAAAAALDPRGVVAIGPRASAAAIGAEIAIDTGLAGVHEGGTAYRLDDVPLPLAALVDGPRSAAGILEALAEAIASRLRS